MANVYVGFAAPPMFADKIKAKATREGFMGVSDYLRNLIRKDLESGEDG